MSRRPTGGQRRWGRRVRKQARKEIVKLAESKRLYIFNEGWNSLGAVGINDPNTDTFIANAHAPIATGVGDTQFIGNEILDPFHVLRLTVAVNWATLSASVGFLPTIRVSAYLVAINDEIIASQPPRLTSLAEDNQLFIRHPNNEMRWQFNSQNVTVIRKKHMYLGGREISQMSTGATTYEVRNMKIAARLRGKKQFEQEITSGGGYNIKTFLKGWNYYWIVVSQISNTAVNAATVNPLRITSDRYIYFKDF